MKETNGDNLNLRKRYIKWVASDGLRMICPGCGESILKLYRTEHLENHTTPAVKHLISRISPPLPEDFYAFCVVYGYDIDNKGPKDNVVTAALAEYLRYTRHDGH